jgi:hypothetical protein
MNACNNRLKVRKDKKRISTIVFLEANERIVEGGADFSKNSMMGY